MTAPPEAKPTPELHQVADWIFDLDNTLYPANCGLFAQVSKRMGLFVARLLDVDAEGAALVQKRLFFAHGTTLRGLMLEYDVEPKAFLTEVHEVDVSVVPPDPRLDAALAALPGRKFVHTNSAAPYAARVLDRIGIARHFTAIHDIEDAGYLPKPDPAGYLGLALRHGIDPGHACMIEDMAANLKPAAMLGMATCWIETDAPWGRTGAEHPSIHYHTKDLAGWLNEVTAGRGPVPIKNEML